MSKGRPWQDLTCTGEEDDHHFQNKMVSAIVPLRGGFITTGRGSCGFPNQSWRGRCRAHPRADQQDCWTKFEDEASEIHGRDCRRRRRGRDTLVASPPTSRPWTFSKVLPQRKLVNGWPATL